MITIVTDSTSDVPPELAEELGIAVVPAVINMEGETLRDGVDIQRPEFYRRQQELSEPATTGAPSPLAFEQVYESAFAAGAEKIFSMHLSSRLSSLHNVAVQGSKKFAGKVQVFDSEQVSLGLGFQVLACARAAQDGQEMEAIVELAHHCRERARSVVMINTLQYLHKSGRIGWLGAGIGKVLSIRLLVEVREGEIRRVGQERTRRKALAHLSELAHAWGELEQFGVGHSGIPEFAREYAAALEHLAPGTALLVDTTPAIGVHVGPGSIGVFGLLRPE